MNNDYIEEKVAEAYKFFSGISGKAMEAFGKNEDIEKAKKKELQDFIRTALQEQRIEIIEECIKLSDEIEMRELDGGTKQWMAFKAFRNTMRDRLSPPNQEE